MCDRARFGVSVCLNTLPDKTRFPQSGGSSKLSDQKHRGIVAIERSLDFHHRRRAKARRTSSSGDLFGLMLLLLELGTEFTNILMILYLKRRLLHFLNEAQRVLHVFIGMKIGP